MTAGLSYSLHTTAFAPVHATHLNLTRMYVPGPVAVLVGYVATLFVLLVLGMFMDRHKPGAGGHGGGGSKHRPPAPQQPPPPGGRELPAADDFAAWERQLQDEPRAVGPDPAGSRREKVPAGR